MEQRRIGELSVSVVGLGCNNFGRRIDAQQTVEVVDAAIDAGINFFDTADMYSEGLSEEYLGRALRGRRDRVVVATKFGAPGSSPDGVKRGSAEWVKKACDQSLKRLGMDRIELYQLHFPDPEVPIEETLGALDDLVKAGKVREIGSSNFGSTRIREADDVSTRRGIARFRTVQNRYSVLTRDPEPKVIPACAERGVGFIPYFPLESGLLTGKYRKGEAMPEGTRLTLMPEEQRKNFLGDERLDRAEQLRLLAEREGHTLLELAMSFLVSNPAVVSVISGATKPRQVKGNTAAICWEISETQRAEIEAIVG